MSGMILSLLSSADNIADKFVFDGYAGLVSTYKTAIMALAGLSITIYGYAVVNGWVKLSHAEVSKRLLVMAFALSLALNWAFFSEYIYDLLTKVPDQIGIQIIQSVQQAAGEGSKYNDQSTLYAALQDFFYAGIKDGDDVWVQGSISDLMPYLWAALMWLMTFLFSGIALFELIIAKFGLSIFLVLSPLTIPMVMFQATKSAIFDGWLRNTLGFALVPIFVMAAVTLSLALDGQILTDIQNSIKYGKLSITDLAPYILCTFVNIVLLLKASAMAASMAGGMSAGIGQGIGGFILGRLSRGREKKDKDKDKDKNKPSNADKPPSN